MHVLALINQSFALSQHEVNARAEVMLLASV